MEVIEDNITILNSPANFVIAGCTGSFKTMFAYKLVSNWPFRHKLANFIIFYNVWQPIFETFLIDFPHVKLIQCLSEKDIEDKETWKCNDDEVNLCLVDDFVDNALKSETFGRLITVYGHHWKIINIFIMQNLYFKAALCTTINRNAYYYVLTQNPHLNILDTLNSQLYGVKGPLKSAYIKAMELKPYNYLLIDVFCKDIKNRLRNNIFPDEGFMKIWRPLNI